METQRNPNTPNARLIRVLRFVLTQPPAGSAGWVKLVREGKGRAGKERKGKARQGKERKGTERKGKERT